MLTKEKLSIFKNKVKVKNELMYLDYINNYLTIKNFALNYNMSIENAKRFLNMMKNKYQ